MTESTNIKIGICDDHPVFVQGLGELLTKHTDFKVVIIESSGKDLLQKLKTHSIDVLLLDLNMPNMDGIELTKIIKKSHPEIRTIIFTMNSEDYYKVHLIELGARGYLLKDASLLEIKEAVQSVFQTGYYLPNNLSEVIAKGLESKLRGEPQLDSTTKFSEREKKIIEMLANGCTNQEIADSLFLSIRTIEGYRNKMLDKAKVKNIAGLIAYAFRNDLLK